MCIYMYVSVYHSIWRSEENLWELVLSFHFVCPGDQTQVVRLWTQMPLTAEPSHQQNFCVIFILFKLSF